MVTWTAETPEDYLAALPDDWRAEKVRALRTMILEVAPDAEEGMGHGMLRYGFGEERVICHLNAQARYVGLYIGRLERLDTDGAVRAAFDCGKTCVRVRRGSPKATKGPVDLSSAERAEPGGLELLRPLIEAEAERVRGLTL